MSASTSSSGGQCSKEVRIELGPIDGRKRSRWEVFQECNGLTEEYESCSYIHEHDDSNRESIGIFACQIITVPAYNECDKEADWD